jgi:hypothetical protein
MATNRVSHVTDFYISFFRRSIGDQCHDTTRHDTSTSTFTASRQLPNPHPPTRKKRSNFCKSEWQTKVVSVIPEMERQSVKKRCTSGITETTFFLFFLSATHCGLAALLVWLVAARSHTIVSYVEAPDRGWVVIGFWSPPSMLSSSDRAIRRILILDLLI